MRSTAQSIPTCTSRSERRGRMRGAAFVELAIALPMLLVGLAITFELGRAFYQYLIMSQVAYEGARAGIQLAGMPPYCFGDRAVQDLAYGAEPNDERLGHYFAQQRARRLIDNYRATGFLTVEHPSNDAPASGAAARIESQMITVTSGPNRPNYEGCDDPSGPSSNEQNSFGVRLTARYQPLLLPMPLTLTTESKGVYLFNNDQFSVGKGTSIIGNKIDHTITQVEIPSATQNEPISFGPR